MAQLNQAHAGDTAAAVRASEDHAVNEVPESERSSMLNITLVRMGFTVSATDLLFGMSLGLYFDFWTALVVALVSSVLVSVVSITCGLIGYREGLTTALITRLTFGREGSRIPALVIALVSIGFVGYSTGITANVLPGDSPGLVLFYCVALSAIYTLVCSIGFERGLTWVGRISVPLMLVAVLVAVVAALDHAGGFGAILDAEPAQPGELGFLAMVALGTAKWMTGATVTPDITRFAKTSKAVYVTTLAEFMVGNFGFNLLGIILGLAVGVDELGGAFTAVGVGALATIAIFVQGFPHEINNLYAGSLAGRSALNVPRLFINLGGGVIAAALAYYGVSQGILESFLEYLGWLAYAIPLIPGIMIADYFVVRRGRYRRRVADAEAVNWRAVLAFWIGLGVNLVLGLALDDTLWRSLPLIGFGLYLLFSARQLAQAWSPRADAAETPRFSRNGAAEPRDLTVAERPGIGRDA